jgi:hypothetical protein
MMQVLQHVFGGRRRLDRAGDVRCELIKGMVAKAFLSSNVGRMVNDHLRKMATQYAPPRNEYARTGSCGAPGVYWFCVLGE